MEEQQSALQEERKEHSVEIGVGLTVAGAAGGGLTLLLIQLTARSPPYAGLIDYPNQRKTHAGSVPLVGGIAMLVAYLSVAAVLLPVTQAFVAFAVCAGITMLVGALDDMLDLRPVVRLVAQAGVATLVIILGDLQIHSLGRLLGGGEIALSPQVGFLFTLFCIVSLINGLNMVDGLDGLAGGLASISLIAFFAAAVLSGASVLAGHLGLFVICLAAFVLFHNLRSPLRRKLVFLGDAGSMVLGLALAWVAISLTQRPGSTLYPIAAVWMLGLVVLDTVATVIRRLMQKRSPLSAGRDHLHHLLLELGVSVPKTVGLMLCVSAVLATVGIAGWRLEVSNLWLTSGFVGISAVYFALVILGWRRVARCRAREVEARVADAVRMPSHLPLAVNASPAVDNAETAKKERVRETA